MLGRGTRCFAVLALNVVSPRKDSREAAGVSPAPPTAAELVVSLLVVCKKRKAKLLFGQFF